MTNANEALTLWDLYRTANRRRAAVYGTLIDGLGNGRSETSVKVSPRRINDHVVLEQGATSDKVFVPESQARTVRVQRGSGQE